MQSISQFCSSLLQRLNPFNKPAPAQPKADDRWNDTYVPHSVIHAQDGGYRSPLPAPAPLQKPEAMMVDGGYHRNRFVPADYDLADPAGWALSLKVHQLRIDIAGAQGAGASNEELTALRQQLADAEQAYATWQAQHPEPKQD